MRPMELNQEALSKIQELIKGNFTGRDELYAAAESLDDDARRRVCRRLAEHLAGHAADLQQIVIASGVDPAGPLDMEAIANALFDVAKANRGDAGVLGAVAEGERNLKDEYDRAIDATNDPHGEDLLRRQRGEVDFAENVLRDMSRASEQDRSKDEG